MHTRGMRCKRHPNEPESVGVCAFCLRERLLALLIAQAKKESENPTRLRDSTPSPLIFPRSVSPYVSSRSTVHHRRPPLFYATPQAGPTYSSSGASKKKNKKKHGKFSLLSSLFSGSGSSRSEAVEADPRAFRPQDSSTPSNSSPWFSSLFPRSRKKKSRLVSLEDDLSGGGGRRSGPVVDRGMSPLSDGKARTELSYDRDDSPIGSDCSSESSTGWRRSESTATAARRTQLSRNTTAFSICLSPLLRASPSQHKSVMAGEFRHANPRHLSAATSICANRSRKMADIGRYP